MAAPRKQDEEGRGATRFALLASNADPGDSEAVGAVLPWLTTLSRAVGTPATLIGVLIAGGVAIAECTSYFNHSFSDIKQGQSSLTDRVSALEARLPQSPTPAGLPSAVAAPSPARVAFSCPLGYARYPANEDNMCELLGHAGSVVPYKVEDEPRAGHLIVGRGVPFNETLGESDIVGFEAAICWPTDVPFDELVPMALAARHVYGQSARRFKPPSWQTRFPRCGGMRIRGTPRPNGDGTYDYSDCSIIFRRPAR